MSWIHVLDSLDLSEALDIRDALLFNISFFCGARALEICNMTWKDVEVLGGGEAVRVTIRPLKNSGNAGSTYHCHIGRRSNSQVIVESTLALIF